MKILYLNPTATLGGAELVLLDVLAALGAARPGWELRLILGEDGPLREDAARLGVECDVRPLPPSVAKLGDAGLRGGRASRLGLATRMPLAMPAALGYAAGLRAAIRRARPDWVHTNGMKAHVLGAWAAPRRVPVLWHLHDYIGSRPVMARLLRLASRRPVSAAAVSQSVADDARAALRGRVPVRTVYNAADLRRFAPGPGDPAMLDAAAGLPPAGPGVTRVGLVATFAHWKGQDVFLEAAARVPDRACRFYIVGGPIYRSVGSQWSLDELRGRAEALGLGGRVGFTGYLDPADAMRALDVVVHASTRPEPFGRVIVEGMACGRAVVAVAGGGSGELFADGEEALGVPSGDPGALASAIARLAGDPGLRRRLGEAGRRAAEARFDRDAVAATWAALYEGSREDIDGPRPSASPATGPAEYLNR